MPFVSAGERRFRTDIQALRGIAVSAVILFHSGLGVAPSGYLGVDMFFVVSGFLIGGIIMRELGEKRFRFADFYLRRIRRLLPAAYIVLFGTLLLSAALLTASAFEHFWTQFAGSLTFSTNIVLWRQINYFNNGAAFEPLLHMWSLAVEEQFYLVLPIVLFIVPKRMWFAAIAIATLASLAAYGWLYPRSPGVAFYLLPTRAWELGIGVLATFAAASTRAVAGARALLPIAALSVVAICFAPDSASGGYWLAVPACLAAAIVIVAGHHRPRTDAVLAPIARVGDFSYSLYLVHWPLFAFAHNIYLTGTLPVWLSIALIATTFALAFALYALIEEPIRRSAIKPAIIWSIAIITSLLLLAGGVAVLHAKRSHAPSIDLNGVTGLSLPFCDGGAAMDSRCSQSANPEILIWGDSLSQAITPGIDATTDHPIVEASKGQCAPLLGIAPVDRDAMAAFARTCLRFNNSVIAYLAKTPSVKVVILSGRYFRLIQDGTRAMTEAPDGNTAIGEAGFGPMLAAQIRTTEALRKLGKRVVLISYPPQASFDVGACWERLKSGLPMQPPGAGAMIPTCAIAGSGATEQAAEGRSLMAAFAQQAKTPVIRLDLMMCHADICPTAWHGVPLYRDADHLSRTGSILVGRRFSLGPLAWTTAR